MADYQRRFSPAREGMMQPRIADFRPRDPGEIVYHTSAPYGSRSVRLRIGLVYRVEPLDPEEHEHRGHRGILVGFMDPEDGRVLFRFEDTDQVKLVDPACLVPGWE